MEFQPMSPEEIQRTVQFLLHQQAQFAADSATSQAGFDARIEKLSAKTEQVADGLIGLTTIVGHVVDSVSQIADAQKRTDEQLLATDARLSESINRVESHLNAVIEMFERHLREDHGHRPS
ncbi:MAG: hypothetical protein HW394_877 [Acidobacteria bacterium]|nr:hypothetical protein [Acidobacteriota bacterium]